jgi:hypothetical protein
MCAQNSASFGKVTGVDSSVQRSWSNQAALAFHDPCVPAAPGPYFNSAPHVTDMISFQGSTVKATKIAVGQSKTVDVQLFSDADTGGPWKVSAKDGLSLMQMGASPYLDLKFDVDQGQNGQTLHLTIKVNKASQDGLEYYYLVSELNSRKNLWVGAVGN